MTEPRYTPPQPRVGKVLGAEWFAEDGKRHPRCDGCGGPVPSQVEHDKACGWSQVKARPR